MNVEEYTREFEKLMIKCDIHEPEEQTMVRYLGGLDPRIANMVELQAFTTFDEICVLAHKVEQQRRSRFHTREEVPTFLSQEQPFNKGSPNLAPKPTPSPHFLLHKRTKHHYKAYPHNSNPIMALPDVLSAKDLGT